MANWIDKKGPVLADTLYDNGELVARDVNVVFPEIVLQSTEMSAMGTMSVPIVGLLEDMELEITNVGVDWRFNSMSKLQRHKFEFRLAQTNIKWNGNTSPESIKVFVHTLPKNIPGFTVNPGDKIERSYKYTVTYLELVINGVQVLLVDRFNNILKVDGKDYAADIESLL